MPKPPASGIQPSGQTLRHRPRRAPHADRATGTHAAGHTEHADSCADEPSRRQQTARLPQRSPAVVPGTDTDTHSSFGLRWPLSTAWTWLKPAPTADQSKSAGWAGINGAQHDVACNAQVFLGANHEHMSGLLEHIDFTRVKVREARAQRNDIVAELRRSSSRLNLGVGGVMISLAMVLLAVGPFIPTPVGIVLLLVVVIGLTSPQGRSMLAQNFLGEQKLNETKHRLKHANERVHFCESWLKTTEYMKLHAMVRPHLYQLPLELLLAQIDDQIRPEHERAKKYAVRAKQDFAADQSAIKLACGAVAATASASLAFPYVVSNFSGLLALISVGTYATGTLQKAAPTLLSLVRKQVEGPAQADLDVARKRFEKWMACRREIYEDLSERRDVADSKIAAALA